jgi:hypothetical protein
VAKSANRSAGSRKRTLDNSSDDDSVPKKKAMPSKKQQRSLRDSDQGGANGEKENKAKTPLEDAKYSAKRMVEALVRRLCACVLLVAHHLYCLLCIANKYCVTLRTETI